MSGHENILNIQNTPAHRTHYARALSSDAEKEERLRESALIPHVEWGAAEPRFPHCDFLPGDSVVLDCPRLVDSHGKSATIVKYKGLSRFIVQREDGGRVSVDLSQLRFVGRAQEKTV